MTRLALLLALLFTVTPASAETLDRFLDKGAKRIARACEKGRVRALSVTPGRAEPVDRELSERLLNKLLALKRIPGCMLSQLAPDATVVVAHQDQGERTVITVRMADEDDLVLFSATTVIENTWTRAPAALWRSGGPCEGAAERVDRMQQDILELKARYWARRLRQGFSASEGRQRPAEMITDRKLAARFENELRQWLAMPRVPILESEEVRRLVTVDSDAYRIYRACRAPAEDGRLAAAE